MYFSKVAVTVQSQTWMQIRKLSERLFSYMYTTSRNAWINKTIRYTVSYYILVDSCLTTAPISQQNDDYL